MGKIDFGNAFSKGWRGFSANVGILVLGALLAGLISFTIILAPIMAAGMFYMCLKSVRGQKVEVGDVFVGFSDFGRFFVGGLLMIAVVFVGLLACCIGVFASAAIGLFFWPHMVDKGKNPGDALGDCWRFFKSDWLMAILFALVSGIVAISGYIVFVFGVFLTLPFAWCTVAAAYDDVFSVGAAPAVAQPIEA